MKVIEKLKILDIKINQLIHEIEAGHNQKGFCQFLVLPITFLNKLYTIFKMEFHGFSELQKKLTVSYAKELRKF
jgi:hypothetical protein